MIFDPSVYLKYDEIVTLLNQWHEENPNITKVYSIGKTYEGRDIMLMEITNQDTGCGEDKPGYYVDGNFHAGEVTGCATAMYMINHIMNNYGTDPDMTYIVDNFVLYVVPRVSCDGSELYLTTPMTLRSSVRPYPFVDKQPGLHIGDINGDGYITQMRIKDPNGNWKVSEKDARLMISRQPDDVCGEFYRVYNEGDIVDYDGFEVEVAQPLFGLDINRNSPVNWKPEHVQKGAGPYPFSEPETRSVGNFILAHRNIAGLMSYHTTSGVHLRPSAQVPDSKMNQQDVKMFKEIGERGKAYTDYPHVNTVEGFVSSPQTGIFMDWAYENEGIISWSTELWDLMQRAGIEIKNFKDRYARKNYKTEEEDGLKLLAWNDKELDGDAFIDWTPFEHPQLGEVEIGGFKTKFFRQNPPNKFLEQECKKNTEFTFVHIKALPKLNIADVKCEKVSDAIYKISAAVQNVGYQPTSGSGIAKGMKKVAKVEASLNLPEGAKVLVNKNKIDLGHMDGWSAKKVEWLIHSGGSDQVTISVTSDRAGKVKCDVPLK